MLVFDTWRLHRKSDCCGLLWDMRDSFFGKDDAEKIDYNEFGGESAFSFLGVEED